MNNVVSSGKDDHKSNAISDDGASGKKIETEIK